MTNYNSSQPRNTYALVVMTNNDKYFITLAELERLKEEAHQLHPPMFFSTTDAKNHTKIDIRVEWISSIVVEGQ